MWDRYVVVKSYRRVSDYKECSYVVSGNGWC